MLCPCKSKTLLLQTCAACCACLAVAIREINDEKAWEVSPLFLFYFCTYGWMLKSQPTCAPQLLRVAHNDTTERNCNNENVNKTEIRKGKKQASSGKLSNSPKNVPENHANKLLDSNTNCQVKYKARSIADPVRLQEQKVL